MRIIVTGGTGFIGRPLVRRLLEDGHGVTVVSRSPARARLRMPAACRFVAWGAGDSIEPSALAGQDVVIHLAGEPVAGGRWTAKRKQAIRASRVDSTRALVAAMAALPVEQRPRALVAASAIGFYGDRGDEVLDEESAAGSGFLVDVCRAWEAEARGAERIGVRCAIVRVGIVLGREGGALAQMLPVFRLGLGGRVAGGAQWLSWIHLDDMVELLRFAATDDGLHGIVNGVAPQPVTNAEFAGAVAAAVRRPAVLPVPGVALRLLFGEMASVLLASQRVEPRRTSEAGFRFRFADLASALADLCKDDEGVLVREQWFARTPGELFPFFGDAHNLEQITPPFVHFRVVGTSTTAIGAGTLINYRLRLHGLPVRWQSVIERWEPLRMFTDSQIHGPYRLWHHTHEFEPRDGGTLVRDRVRYRLPLGALGDLVAGALVRRDLEAIFDFRHARLDEIFAPARRAS